MKPLCDKCKDTGVLNVFTGGGTEPRMPGTPQVIGTRMSSSMCIDSDCLARRVRDIVKPQEQERIKPRKLGHEAHCSAGRHPEDQCCCFYPELERLWEREATLEKALRKMIEFGADPDSSAMESLIDCVELAEAILDGKEITPTKDHSSLLDLSDDEHSLSAAIRYSEALIPDKEVVQVQANQQRTGQELDIAGHVDNQNIEYLGKAYELTDGTWCCLANIHGMLGIVEVTITKALTP